MISPNLIMNCPKYGSWACPFKKFSRLRDKGETTFTWIDLGGITRWK
jgi:hypothetical protein